MHTTDMNILKEIYLLLWKGYLACYQDFVKLEDRSLTTEQLILHAASIFKLYNIINSKAEFILAVKSIS